MMTRKQKAAARWTFDGSMRNAGSNRIWTIQRDTVTGKRRWISYTNSGREVIRYQRPKG